jgi:hypothetical protein
VTMRTTALALLAALALLVAGCGSDSQKGKPIPSPQVAELNKQLDAVQRRFERGDGACGDITNDSEPAIRSVLDQIPSNVDRKVRDALRQSVDRLFQLTASQCDTTPTDTNTTPTDTNPTPTDTNPTPTDTNPTPTDTGPTPTDTQPTTPDNVPPGQLKPKKQKNKGTGDGNTGNGGGPAAPGGA